MKLIRAQCCAQSGPSPHAEQCSVLPKWNIDILSQNSASITPFFQVQAIKAGHVSTKYRQTGDILSVSSKGTAAAKWLMKISRYLCQYCRYWLQNFTVTLCQLYAKDDFNGSLQRCRGFSHCKIIAAKISHCILPQSQWVWMFWRNKIFLSSI